MSWLLEYLPETVRTFLLSFVALYIVVNPSGVAAVFLGLTKNLDRVQRAGIAIRAVVAGMTILTLFAVAGKLIFDLAHITAAALQVAGGIFIFGFAFALARGKEAEYFGHLEDTAGSENPTAIAYAPLAVPLIAGPASILVVMTSSAKAPTDPYAWAALLITIAGVGGLCLLSMFRWLKLEDRVGKGLSLILPRIMGLILAVIAVQFMIEGLLEIIPRFADAIAARPKPGA